MPKRDSGIVTFSRPKKMSKTFLKLSVVFVPLFVLVGAFIFNSVASTFVKAQVADTQGYTSNNGTIYKDNSPLALHGVNWFGFESGTLAPHGLWARNWKDMISQMKSTGVNAVRVPFCPQTLSNLPTSSIEYSINTDLVGLNSMDIMDKVLGEFSNQQIAFLLDFHTSNCQSLNDLWYTNTYSADQWVNDLKTITNRYKNNNYFLGVDLKNEPQGSATWGTGNIKTDWNTAAENAGSQLLAIDPHILIFVEGVSENPICSTAGGHFWGENLEPINCTPISTDKIPSNRLVLSPHIYGPDVYSQAYFDTKSFPSNMPAIWDTQFGNLVNKGYTLVPGEWGGKYGNGGDPKDVA